MTNSVDHEAKHELLAYLDEEVRACLARASEAQIPHSRHLLAEAEELARLRANLASRLGDTGPTHNRELGEAA